MKNGFPRTLRPGLIEEGEAGGEGHASPPPPSVTVDVKPKARPLQTQFAMRALGLAERFAQVCGAHGLDGDGVTYRLELAAPEGPSTGGGKQAVQHVKLVPNRGTTIVIGQANQVEGRA